MIDSAKTTRISFDLNSAEILEIIYVLKDKLNTYQRSYSNLDKLYDPHGELKTQLQFEICTLEKVLLGLQDISDHLFGGV